MLRVHRCEQDCQYVEDTKRHKLYYIPAEQCGIFQILHGAMFAGAALCGVALGLSLPLWMAVSSGCMLLVLLKLYEHRVFLPRLSCVKKLLKQMDISRRQNQKLLIVSGFLIVFPLLILWNQTYQNPAAVTLTLAVTGISALQFIRQLRILRKRRML